MSILPPASLEVGWTCSEDAVVAPLSLLSLCDFIRFPFSGRGNLGWGFELQKMTSNQLVIQHENWVYSLAMGASMGLQVVFRA